MKKLGLIVNPIAGIGGRLGLKGSDGVEIQKKALRSGAKLEAPVRAAEALKILLSEIRDIQIITYPCDMGENAVRACNVKPKIIGSIEIDKTTAKDTRRAVRDLKSEGVDLLLFAGGDGTARDVYNAVGDKMPAIGIPAGVKIHSGVYAINPQTAGRVAAMYLSGKLKKVRESEVMDIDEDAFRAGQVKAKLYGYLRVPEERRFVQHVKSANRHSETEILSGIADEVIQQMDDESIYIIGPGTTTRPILEKLGLKKTLLGVDAVQRRTLIANDLNEEKILTLIDGRTAKIVVTAIGGQGHIFGRGNQQISPKVIRMVGKEHIQIVASTNKLTSLNGRPLLVDSGDSDLDSMLTGYYKIITGFGEYAVYKVGY